MLRYLKTLDPERCGIVRWMGDFRHGPHRCLVFELLDQTLTDFAWQREDHSLPLDQIRNIVEQVRLDLNLNTFALSLLSKTKHIVVFCVS